MWVLRYSSTQEMVSTMLNALGRLKQAQALGINKILGHSSPLGCLSMKQTFGSLESLGYEKVFGRLELVQEPEHLGLIKY